MAPKADSTKKTASKAKSGPPKHAPFLDMIKDAIMNLKERNGSSRQAIKKYIQANNDLSGLSDQAFNNHISRALSSGEENGVFERPKGPSGPVKLKKGGAKPAAEKKTEAKPKPAATKKAPATKKTASTKKAPATKKTTTTKKTTAAKPKANASKPRAKKAAPSSAPAVGEEKSVVLGKTKSGRVTKSKAPQAAKPAAKKAAAKKTGTKKAPAKKSATPKKAEAA